MDVANSTLIVPNFDHPGAVFIGYDGTGPVDSTGEVVLNALHVPEPAIAVLMGLGLLGSLCARRRR